MSNLLLALALAHCPACCKIVEAVDVFGDMLAYECADCHIDFLVVPQEKEDNDGPEK